MSFETTTRFGRSRASFGRQGGTTQKSDRGASRRKTSSAECAATRERVKESSRPIGRDPSESEKSQRGELFTWNGFREKFYLGRGMAHTSNFITAEWIKLRTLSSPYQGGFDKAFFWKYLHYSHAKPRVGLDEALTSIPCRDRSTRFGLDETLTGIPCQHLTLGSVWMKP